MALLKLVDETKALESVGGDDSAGNTLQLQGNKTEWKQ